MINIEVENQHVVDKLNQLGKLAPRAARDAINHTATAARVKLLRAAQERYTVKASGFKSDATITKATVGSLTAWIRSKGSPLPLRSFHSTAAKSGAKAEVLSGSGLKTIVGAKGIKAFVHGMIFQRRDAPRYPIKGLSGPSVPKQLEMVYTGKSGAKQLKKEIDALYVRNMQAQLKRFIG